MALSPDESTLARVEIALAQAKRVRRESTLTVQTLAALRDELQPSEKDTSNNDEH